MARVKILFGAMIALGYILISFLLPWHRTAASSVIIAREEMLRDSRCNNCVLLAGGSNAVYGIQSGQIEVDLGLFTNKRSVINVSLLGEGFAFDNYYLWLSRLKLKPIMVIYSSASVYALNRDSRDSGSVRRLDGESRFSIMSSERLIRLVAKHSSLLFDRHGDLVNFPCGRVQPILFKPFDATAAEQFIRNVESLSNLFIGARVVIRIPPAYVLPAQYADWIEYFTLLRKVFDQRNLTGRVLGLFPEFTPDAAKFCDTAFHPTKSFRERLSHELADEIKLRAPLELFGAQH
jgi:hypothetical protein